jgi:hypothetical protein
MRPIKAGEALTACKNRLMPLRSIAERRRNFFLVKGFTCHCPRCDAEGDDTRQFDCFDPNCQGRHFVRQPLDSAPLPRQITQQYEGVTYENPHLLPCTACQRTPPKEYEERMLKLEEHLHQEIDRYMDIIEWLRPGQDCMTLYAELLNLPIPRHHALQCKALEIRNYVLSCHLSTNSNANCPPMVREGLKMDVCAAELAESLLPGAMQEVREGWIHVSNAASLVLDQRALCKLATQRAIRLLKLVGGREQHSSGLDARLLRTLEHEPVPQEVVDMAVCAFCEESPQRAALTLSKCVRCKKVVYCSKGCQKAHWKLHKMYCKDTTSTA